MPSIFVPPRSMPIRMGFWLLGSCSWFSFRRTQNRRTKNLLCFAEQRVEVQRVRHVHRNLSISRPRPFSLGPIAGELDTIAVDIGEIDRLAHPVVCNSLNRNPCLHHSPDSGGQI